MTPIAAYLTFDGNCREAMTFYQQCLGGELQAMTFAEGRFDDGYQAPPEARDRLLHACLSGDSFSLMASDTMPGMSYTAGNHVSLYLACRTPEEVDTRFAALSDGGTVTMQPADVFWGSYFAMLTDRYGMGWMLSFDHVPAAT